MKDGIHGGEGQSQPATPAHIDEAWEELLERTRSALARRYAISGEFVGVPTLARILGMGQATIYEHMRMGKFFLPHRKMNKTPRVPLDALVVWQCGPQPMRTGEGQASVPPRRGHPPSRLDDAMTHGLTSRAGLSNRSRSPTRG